MANNNDLNIVNTPIIMDSYDVLWDVESLKRKALTARPVLVVISSDIQEEERELLGKIIAACKLSEPDYNLMELADGEQIAWHLLRDELKVTTVVLFGISPGRLGVAVQLMPHQTNRFDGSNWIPTATPGQMIAQPEIKNHLWNYGLKPVFIDKIYS